MKRIFLVAVAVSIVFLAAGSALAWGHPHWGVRAFIGPPLILPPPPVVHYSYPPPYDYYYGSHRVWVPGYWDWRWTPRGWLRARVPGHWGWR